VWSPDGDGGLDEAFGTVAKALAARAGPDGKFEFSHAEFGVHHRTTDRHGGERHADGVR